MPSADCTIARTDRATGRRVANVTLAFAVNRLLGQYGPCATAADVAQDLAEGCQLATASYIYQLSSTLT